MIECKKNNAKRWLRKKMLISVKKSMRQPSTTKGRRRWTQSITIYIALWWKIPCSHAHCHLSSVKLVSDLFGEQNFLRSVHFHFQFSTDFSPESLTIICIFLFSLETKSKYRWLLATWREFLIEETTSTAHTWWYISIACKKILRKKNSEKFRKSEVDTNSHL